MGSTGSLYSASNLPVLLIHWEGTNYPSHGHWLFSLSVCVWWGLALKRKQPRTCTLYLSAIWKKRLVLCSEGTDFLLITTGGEKEIIMNSLNCTVRLWWYLNSVDLRQFILSAFGPERMQSNYRQQIKAHSQTEVDNSRHHSVQKHLDICSSLPSHRHP